MSPSPKKPSKDTIYVDIEDEITAIIDKLSKAEAKVVALVLPKRAATLQSVVNLKLLKRAAENAKKNIVLITSDHGVMSLAGVAGLHVAKTLQSKPSIPVNVADKEAPITVDSDAEPRTPAAPEPVLNPKASIGSLAGEDETIDVGEAAGAVAVADTVKAVKKDKNRKLSIPNFDKFRMKIILGSAILLVLILGWVFASIVMPRANITIATDTSQVNASLVFDAKADQKTADYEKNILPAYKKELKKSSVEKVPTTGKRDDGTKATGTMTIINCSTEAVSLPAGTVFTAGTNFLSDAAVSIPKSSYSFTAGGFVCDKNGKNTVAVTAQNGGASNNLSARAYQIQNGPTNVTAQGSDMAGGTSKLVSIVGQADIDSAKQQALDKLSQSSSADLRKQFSSEGALGLEGSLENQPPTTTSDPEVGKEATEVSVTVNVTYAMYGVKRDEVIQAIEKEVNKKIDTSKQAVQNTGLDQADVRVTDKPSAGVFRVTVQTTAVAGPKLDTEGIKKDIAGKRKGQAQDIISSRPGVTKVDIKYSPFWVSSTPKRTNHINITFTEADAKNQ